MQVLRKLQGLQLLTNKWDIRTAEAQVLGVDHCRAWVRGEGACPGVIVPKTTGQTFQFGHSLKPHDIIEESYDKINQLIHIP